MSYEFSFYKDFDFKELEELVIKSYEWEKPAVGLSRIEFSRGLHPAFTGFKKAWQHTVGVYRDNGKIAACVWNEGTYEGDVFFLFDSKERAEDRVLLADMINFAKMYGIDHDDDPHTIFCNLYIPSWNKTLLEMAKLSGFIKKDWSEQCFILPFNEEKSEVNLPEGYSIIDGNTSPDFYLSNVHRMAFGYGSSSTACEHGEEAFNNLRKMNHYDKELDLCVLDPMKRPVAIAIIWCDEKMPYCELEPLGVVWWERRKGIATAILHEACNRVMKKYPSCIGMKGGDQQFYSSIGYKKCDEVWQYRWERTIHISWEKESINEDYAREMEWNKNEKYR